MAGGCRTGQSSSEIHSPRPAPHFNMTEIWHLQLGVKQSWLLFPLSLKLLLLNPCVYWWSLRSRSQMVCSWSFHMHASLEGYSLLLSHNMSFPQVIECSYLDIRRVSLGHLGCLQFVWFFFFNIFLFCFKEECCSFSISLQSILS